MQLHLGRTRSFETPRNKARSGAAVRFLSHHPSENAWIRQYCWLACCRTALISCTFVTSFAREFLTAGSWAAQL
eukprot:6208045-Pleurochrysis_carterae.AAC.2